MFLELIKIIAALFERELSMEIIPEVLARLGETVPTSVALMSVCAHRLLINSPGIQR